MEISPHGQVFYESEANALFPGGCTEGNNNGGECNWCAVYYGDIPARTCEFDGTVYFEEDGCPSCARYGEKVARSILPKWFCDKQFGVKA